LWGYGTGAIMAVPAEDERDREFAEKFGLEIKPSSCKSTPEGKKQVNYHIHDWSISRQRYWGTPVPMVDCKSCGIVPVSYEDLPVELPYEVDYTPKGKAPLESNEEWLKVKCPKCSGPATRDPETLDTFFDSSWYFLRFLDPKYIEGPFPTELANKMMPVDIYFGGGEHTLGHTLYARFFTKFFQDLGILDQNMSEFASRRIQHGIVLGPDGAKMSKSKGNVVNPDDEVKKYGTDAVRIHVAFFMPYDGVGPWISERIWGPYRFIEKVWNLCEKVGNIEPKREDLHQMHKTIKSVTEDIENIKFNTAIASLMEWSNYLTKKTEVSKLEYETLLLLFAPFAPFVSEELWSILGHSTSIHTYSWPIANPDYFEADQAVIVVQVNGKVRTNITVEAEIKNNEDEIRKISLANERVQKFLEGKDPKKTIFVPGKLINFLS
jgi:leucyl-tRNA synthetase